MTIASKHHIPLVWRVFLRLVSSSSCCGISPDFHQIFRFLHRNDDLVLTYDVMNFFSGNLSGFRILPNFFWIFRIFPDFHQIFRSLHILYEIYILSISGFLSGFFFLSLQDFKDLSLVLWQFFLPKSLWASKSFKKSYQSVQMIDFYSNTSSDMNLYMI